MKYFILSALVLWLIPLQSCVTDRHGESEDLYIRGVNASIIPLNGTWKWTSDLPENFWSEDIDRSGWPDIQVPGEPAMQGFEVVYDKPFAYATRFRIPSDFKGQNILLRFDGVYSYARLWVNGVLIRDHRGGFTRWHGEITDVVEPGEEALLVLEVTDEIDDISYGSGYAHHPIGGILRNVCLVATPRFFPESFILETRLVNDYHDGKLTVYFRLPEVEDGHLAFTLSDPGGAIVASENFHIEHLTGDYMGENTITVEHVLAWDAEHPNLYTLETEYWRKGAPVWRKVDKIGFREVKIDGNRLLVNGRSVKLRGACRHDIHPTLGRVADRYYDSLDVLLAKEANINFIRTSHYPPSEDFVRFCDEYGIYVECESAVCFVQTHRKKDYVTDRAQDNPAYADQFDGQVREMVATFRNHPSVIMWSLGNESRYGRNVQNGYDWIKSTDLTRPVIFSYPGTVPDSVLVYDLLSMHYPSEKGNIINQFGLSMEAFKAGNVINLNDEWAHVPCYNVETLKRDPNVRDFWGQSLDIMWRNAYQTDGCLGGAIWGYVDETFMLPDSSVGYGEWGVIDTWRRKKPEFWNTKKAYSPVKVLETHFAIDERDTILEVPIQNRFDHTNIKELTMVCDGRVVNKSNRSDTDIPPGGSGAISLPLRGNKKSMELSFWNSEGQLIDQYVITIGGEERKGTPFSIGQGAEWTVEEKEETIVFESGGIIVELNRASGLIEVISWNGTPVVTGGPYLQFLAKGHGIRYSVAETENLASGWSLRKLKHRHQGSLVTIQSKGLAGDLSVIWEIVVHSSGKMTIDVTAGAIPEKMVAEFGVMLPVSMDLDQLEWTRDGYWTCYPAQHISSNEGRVVIYEAGNRAPDSYRQQPVREWEMDARNFFLYGLAGAEIDKPLKNIAAATKENIYSYAISSSDNDVGLTVLSDGNISCRIMRIGETANAVIANGLLDYVNLSWGNYIKDIRITGTQSEAFEFFVGPVE